MLGSVQEIRRQMIKGDGQVLTENEGTLLGVLEFVDIAWPGLFEKDLHDIWATAPMALSNTVLNFLQK